MEETELDLPELTAKQFKFVQGILEGMTASDAYRAAYDTESMAESTVWAEASRLKSDHKVSAWLAYARQEAMATAVETKQGYLRELERLKRQCEETNNWGAAVKACELQGKVQGHYVDKHEDVTEGKALEELHRQMEANPRLQAILKAMEMMH